MALIGNGLSRLNVWASLAFPPTLCQAAEVFSGAVLAATEAPDSILFTQAPVSIQDARGYILKRDHMRVRVLASTSFRVRILKYPVARPREMINMHGRRTRQVSGARVRDLEKA